MNMNYNKSYTAVGKIVILLVVLSVLVTCNSFTNIDIPVDEKISRIEKGLFPVNGFPPWKKRESIYERMRHYKIPGVSIAVINDFKLEWVKGYGVMAAGGKKPITTDTLFQAVGVSSTVSRFLALNFVDRGIIDLNEDVNHKLVSWKIPENEFTAKHKVTLRSLLKYNAAGLNEFSIKGYSRGTPLPGLRQILEGKEPANTPAVRVIAQPGIFRRSPSGNLFLVSYIVVQQLLEDVAKKPFHEIAHEIILEPLGMKNSTFEQPLPKEYQQMAATGHVKTEQSFMMRALPGDNKINQKLLRGVQGGGFLEKSPPGRRRQIVPTKGKWHTFPETAAKGLWTTPSDMACLAVELMKTCKGQSQKIISQDTVFHLVSRRRSFYHFYSSSTGFDCFLACNYKTGQGVVIMINSNNAYALRKEILHSVFSQNRWKWGYFTMAKTIFTGMLLVIAIAIMGLIIILGGLLFFLGKRKKRYRNVKHVKKK
jgi:CubicO group peptidase (beta-lactamase class C family)